MTDKTKLILSRAALVAAGTFFLASPWHDWLMRIQLSSVTIESVNGLLRGIGEAFIVALVLELLVDTPLKHHIVKETVKEAIEGVAPRILAHLLPPSIFRSIEEQVLQANWVRRTWDITYRIDTIETHRDYVKLETDSIYEMANLASSRASYRAVYEVEGACTDVGPTKITEVKVINLLAPAGARPVFQYPGCVAELGPKPVDDSVVFDQPFEIPVHKEPAAMQFVFRSTEHFHVGSIVPFFAKYVVENTTLRVIYPKESLKVIVDFPANKDSELHPEKGASGNDSYVFPKPILPGQGFTVRFLKVDNAKVEKKE